jgi:tRNA A-37 threonylcarbamoyl transferase component Bud32
VNIKELTGQKLGRYQIIEALGQGGMASVYKAYDTSLERFVAIKIIRVDLDDLNDGEFLKRFQREARALAQLDHPYILKVLDYGEQEGLPYLVMPFVQGGTLKERMGAAMPYQKAAALLVPIARALDYAHHQKIIHRDIKPANILMSQSGAPILSDFGIAKILETEASTQLTATGAGIGTPDYMAPEQWLGNSNPFTDIYSLGIVFYEMVTGRRPFSADTPAGVLVKHLQDPLPRPTTFVPSLPESVEQVLYKALAKDPKNRFQDMGDFANALEKLERSEQTYFAPIPTDVATVQSLDIAALTNVQQGRTFAAATQAAVAPPKKMGTWQMVLLVVGVVGALAFICVLIGGAYWATRAATSSKQNTPAATRPAASTLSGSTSQPAVVTSIVTLPVVVHPTKPVEPFTTIEGLPDDIPILLDNNGDLFTNKGQQGMITYSFSSKLTFAEVSDFYMTGMKTKNWQILNESSSKDYIAWSFMKDQTRMVMISFATSDKGGTFISIMLLPAQ